MNKRMRLAAAVTGAGIGLLGGCASRPVPKPSPRVAPVPPPAVPTQTTAPAAAKPADGPAVGSRVVEIITHPRLVSRPTTQRAGSPARTTGATPAADVPAPKLPLDTLSRVDTAIDTAPLMRLLAMKLNGIPYTRFAGYGALDFTPDLPEGTNPDAITNDILAREPGGSAAAIKRLVDRQIDLALVPRVPTDAEAAAAGKAKVRLRADLVATEALVFTVNAASPITNLTQAQLVAIFTGRDKVWKDLGEKTVSAKEKIADEPITVAYRAKGTGSEELLSQLLLGGKAVPELPISRALAGSKLVLDASTEDPQTIGFSTFAYATNMGRDGRVRVLAIDGVLPEPSRVASGEYPLTTPLYVLTRADLSAETNLFRLRTWLGSMNGQRTLAEAGYMPVASEAWTAVRLMGK